MEIFVDIKITKWRERQAIKCITNNSRPMFEIRHNVTGGGVDFRSGPLHDNEIEQALVMPKKETYFVRIINKGESGIYGISESGIQEMHSGNPKGYLWTDFWLIKYNSKYFFLRMNDGESYFVIPRKALVPEDDNKLMAFFENSYRDGIGRKLERL